MQAGCKLPGLLSHTLTSCCAQCVWWLHCNQAAVKVQHPPDTCWWLLVCMCHNAVPCVVDALLP